MTGKPLIPRERAHRDVEEAIEYYVEEAGTAVALRFVDAIDEAYRQISRRPAAGSPSYAHLLDLPGLRNRKLQRFPYLVFYMERADRIEIWRVLHVRRDIPSWIADLEN